MNKLWRELLTRETLTRGWHLARDDVRQDFAEDLYSTDVYAQDLRHWVQETINRLGTNTYQPRPLFRIEVPKGPLAFRPGAVIPIQDRVVLSALVLLVASDIDRKYPDSVYSWRLKDPVPKKGPIFKETDVTDLPFLKRKTIREEVDPFEGWYQLWPEFDRKTRRVFQEEGYRYMATSDIAAYFENIQLPILRDSLMKHLSQEIKIVNLFCLFFEAWCDRTGDGRAHHRGIPQGNFISSFLGNFFLLPLDEAFQKFGQHNDVKYFRYMDDVRIFTRTREDARLSILLMARVLRSLHLNVQTAKTRIYDELRGEVTGLLIDERVEELSAIIDSIQKNWKGKKVVGKQRSLLLGTLADIAKRDALRGQKITGGRAPLEGLALRAFNRWITAHSLIESDIYVGRLLTEISKSSDSKLTRKLISTQRRFPRKTSIETNILRMLESKQIIFPYQTAECLRALRYSSKLSAAIVGRCWKFVLDRSEDRYLRMESAYLLTRTELSKSEIGKLTNAFDVEPDAYVQAAMACLLVQKRVNNQQLIRMLVFHPNEKVRDIGKLFRTVKYDENFARDIMRHCLRKETPWVTCDYMPFLHLMSVSKSSIIRKFLLDSIRRPRLNHPISGVRDVLKGMFTRVRESLE